jgi:glycerol kinase
MEKDAGRPIAALRVDGGASASDLLMQLQADAVGVKIERPRNVETTALGAAMMAGLGAGVWGGTDELAAIRETDRTFLPAATAKDRRARLKQWRNAVKRARGWAAE